LSGWGPTLEGGATGSGNPPASGSLSFTPTATLSNTEYFLVIPDHTKILYIAPRTPNVKMKISWVAGGVNGTAYITLHYGNHYLREGLDLVGKTLYYSLDKPGVEIEIEAWV
jgi:hypothetical protein